MRQSTYPATPSPTPGEPAGSSREEAARDDSPVPASAVLHSSRSTCTPGTAPPRGHRGTTDVRQHAGRGQQHGKEPAHVTGEAHRRLRGRPEGGVAVITLIVAGLGLLVLVAIVVGIVEAAQAPAWRRIAKERRARWEARQPQLHGHAAYGPYAYDDESWDDD